VTQLLFVQCARGFLAIARDEGDGVAVIEQADGRGDLFRPHTQFGGDVTFVLHDGILRLRVDHTPHFWCVQSYAVGERGHCKVGRRPHAKIAKDAKSTKKRFFAFLAPLAILA
jgi:hypothetical protein